MSRTFATLGLVCVSYFFAAGFVFAQDDTQAQLMAEIRSAIVADPRAQTMSEAELNGMVEALAVEAEAQDVATEFVLPPLPTFADVETYFSTIETPWGQPITPTVLYGVVLMSLLLAIGLLWWMAHMHHPKLPDA